MITFVEKLDGERIVLTSRVQDGEVNLALKDEHGKSVFVAWLSRDGELWRCCLDERGISQMESWGFKLTGNKITVGNPDFMGEE